MANGDLPGLVDIAREFLEKVTMQLDPHTSQKGVIEVGEREVTLLTPSHIQFAIHGRGPGKNPPLDPLLKWVKEKGIRFGKSTERGTAFALQKYIAKHGTKNWNKNAPNALEEAIKDNFDEYNRQVGNALSVVIEDELADIYKEVFPSSQEFRY